MPEEIKTNWEIFKFLLHSVKEGWVRKEEFFAFMKEKGFKKGEIKRFWYYLLSLNVLRKEKEKYVFKAGVDIQKGIVRNVEGREERIGIICGEEFFPLSVPVPQYFSEGDEVAIILKKWKRGKSTFYLFHLQREKTKILLEVKKRRRNLYLSDLRNSFYIYLPPHLSLEEGDVIKAKIAEFPRDFTLESFEKIGKRGEIEIEIRIIFEKNNAPLEHEKCSFSCVISPSLKTERVYKDMRDIPFMTLDVDNAMDHDDAVAVERTEKGYRLYVAISDVSSQVRPESNIDKVAFKRGLSIYYSCGFSPMLPPELTKALSILPERDSPVIIVEMEFDRSGNEISSSIYPGIIRSRGKFYYSEVSDFLDGNKEINGEIADHFLLMKELAMILREKRIAMGSFDFDLPEQFFIFDNGLLTDVKKYSEDIPSHIIEEFMICANKTVARFTFSQGIDSIYRVHPPPGRRELLELKKDLRYFDFNLKRMEKEDINQVIKKVKGTPLEKPVILRILRAMKFAEYSHQNTGHYALSLKCYTHFTSPIRRYADIVVHRCVKKALFISKDAVLSDGLSLEDVAKYLSALERRGEEIEREINKFYSALLLKSYTGKKMEGVVTGAVPGGVFVQIEEPYLEGFIPRRLMRNTFPQPGSKILVKVHKVDPVRRIIDFLPLR